jgi:hypothetical protein
MTALLLDRERREVLSRLIGTRVRQLVWDANAIYFVAAPTAVKVEAVTARPASPEPDEWDEAACLDVEVLGEAPTFLPGGEDGY